MRVAAVMLVALAASGIASGATPPGFYDAARLAPAASFVAEKPVRVYCSKNLAVWNAFLVSTGRDRDSTSGSSVVGSSETKLSNVACAMLLAQLNRNPVSRLSLAASIQTLVHESIHMRGVRDEGETDCAAIHEVPRVAVKFFGIKSGRQLRGLMADAWRYRNGPGSPEYRAVC